MNLKYDDVLNIAVGRSRKETNWKNKEMLWSELVEKLSETHRTAETYAEYIASSKSRQDEIKDIGGFVGGFISGRRRKSGSIINRQLITLDIDFGTKEAFDELVMFFGCSCVMYSTHKNGPEQFRGRIVLPIDRPVFRDEYQAISRKIAGAVNIEIFDDTTFEPSRLMYWPSTPKNGEYIFEYNDGPWLCADEILASYFDWKDTSSWPSSNRSKSDIQREIKKQGDPLEKPGLIGAFCRCYSIQEAISNFLSDVYEECGNGRYTFKEGSTAAGMVVYDDKFAYSHHGTDPASGKLCNAFDLVRLHKFGFKDEDAKENTAGNRLPSYTEMVDFVSKIPDVRKRLAEERINAARGDFENVEVDCDEVDDSWMGALDTDRKGNNHQTIDNVIIILSNDQNIKSKLTLDEFKHKAVITGDLPWRRYNPEKPYLEDLDDAGLRHYMENCYGIASNKKIEDGVNIVLNRNAFHPIRDYLNSWRWDGIERLDTIFIVYQGAEDSPYIRAVARKSFTAAVARVFQPGIKFDYVPTLIGPQGGGKSTLLYKIGGMWYSDSFTTVNGKEAYEQIQGVWIVEIGELAGLKKAEVETVKHFISKREDIFRPPYGRRTSSFPRQCVFFGTTNKRDFLKDPTGNRRFWPIDTMKQKPTKSVFTDLDEYTVGMLWAEAVYRYKQGENLYLPAELEAFAVTQQEGHSEENSKTGLIQEYLDKEVPENWYQLDVWQRRNIIHGDADDLFKHSSEGCKTFKRDKICVAEIWCELFRGELKDLDKRHASDIREAMGKIEDWGEYDLNKDKGRLRFGTFYGKQKAYKRKNTVPL